MSDAIPDALIITLANIHAHADVTFNLDSAINVLETAHATLETATRDEKRQLQDRAASLAARSQDAELIAFLTAFVDQLAEG